MRCISKKAEKGKRRLLAVLMCCIFLCGCSQGSSLTDPYMADRPGLGVQGQSQEAGISYFAENLCVVNGDVTAIEADTSAASAACLFNLGTREILYARNVHDRLYPASTTKIMTALLTLEHGELDAQVSVSKDAITFTESGVSTASLKEGDVLTVRQLLYALLLPSANDAANVLAEHIGGSSEQFVALMNEKAKKIGATNTHFMNPNGLHDEEHYTTAYDLYLMFQEALKYDEFVEIIRMPAVDVTYLSADGSSVETTWSSSNLFTKGDITVPDGVTAVGGKTGTTKAARSCLVQLFEDAQGERYAAIILGCEERNVLYEEMQSFLSGLGN